MGGTQTLAVTRQKRGIFGKLCLFLFWGWNAFCIYALVAGIGGATRSCGTITTNAERVGATIGPGLGVGVILFVWVVGVIIFGAMAMLTRGRSVTVTTVREL